MKKKFYVTSAIAYPNGPCHLGHALEIVQCDIVARFNRLVGKEVVFQTGTDEHGTKNWQTAKKEGKTILEFLDSNVQVFKDLYSKLNISYDNFIRTSNKEVHYPGVQKLWKALVEAGDIYKQKYSGLYCSGCESFKTEKELVEGKCPNHPTREIEEVSEENYFFKLSKYKDELISKIKSDEYKVIPESRKNEILSWLPEANDISFSRPKSTLPWGIPVPDDPEHVMYVWCDALSNYITGAGYGTDSEKFNSTWPCDVHIIGKDILRFHAAFWPAMLISGGIKLPKSLMVHGFVLSKGSKMGKSTGNVVEPFEQIDKYGVDQFRFYLACAMPLGDDGDYTEEAVIERVNTELVGNLSNFCYRVLSFTNKNFDSSIKDIDEDKIIEDINGKIKEIKAAYLGYDFKKAIDEILAVSALGNKYFQEKEPWKLIKEDKDQALAVLGTCVNIVKCLTILAEPIIPNFSKNIQEQLNVSGLGWDDIDFNLKNHGISDGKIIINKVDVTKNKETKDTKDEQEGPKFPLNLKVAKIVSVDDHPDAEKLYVLQIDLGTEKRQLVGGIKEYYSKEELVGKKIIVVSNLKKAKLRGVESQGMLLAGETSSHKSQGDLTSREEVGLLNVTDANLGSEVTVEGYVNNTSQVRFDDFEKVKLKVKDGKVVFGDIILKVDNEEIKVDKVTDGIVG